MFALSVAEIVKLPPARTVVGCALELSTYARVPLCMPLSAFGSRTTTMIDAATPTPSAPTPIVAANARICSLRTALIVMFPAAFTFAPLPMYARVSLSITAT